MYVKHKQGILQDRQCKSGGGGMTNKILTLDLSTPC